MDPFFFTLLHLDKYIWLKGDWHPLERVLSITSPKSGWVRVSVFNPFIVTVFKLAVLEGEAEVLCSLLCFQHCNKQCCDITYFTHQICPGFTSYSLLSSD